MSTAPLPTSSIAIGGRYFVPNGKLIDTLFRAGGTGHGEYRRIAGGILFSDGSGAPRVLLVINRWGERFFVTATRQNDGRLRFMHALSDNDCTWLGAPEQHTAQSELAHTIADTFLSV